MNKNLPDLYTNEPADPREKRAEMRGRREGRAKLLRIADAYGPLVAMQAIGYRRSTHRCKVCGAHWRLNDPSPVQPEGSWSLVHPFNAGKCCDNVAMGDQIEAMTERGE